MARKLCRYCLPFVCCIVVLLTACGGSGTGGGNTGTGNGNTLTPSTGTWTWMSGSNTALASGIYGTQGVPSSGNAPGAREEAVCWIDLNGNFWLLGGWGLDSTGQNGWLNDLWEFSPTDKAWTWVRGSNIVGSTGSYGTQGIPSTSNTPGARKSAASWTDSTGNLWLFGGDTLQGQPNDLWEFSPTTKMWTWIGGSSNPIGPARGVYGTQGVAAAGNIPGGRSGALSWTDNNGNLWLFGGNGLDPTSVTNGYLNDLWEFNPTSKMWTWVSGANIINASPSYGTQGVAAATNILPGRMMGVSWTDKSGNFWLFGGSGYYPGTPHGWQNDLWEFSPATKMWTWVSGANTPNATASYGTQGVAAATNVPGARNGAVSWTDQSGKLWLMGGGGMNSTGTAILNDLWEFNPTTKVWTWAGGSNTGDAKGVYGTQAVTSAGNAPGSRAVAVGASDGHNNFWLFGGSGYDSTGAWHDLNDLWLHQP